MTTLPRNRYSNMYYATHRLYVSNNNPLRLHVVKVEQGRVHSFFPFDGERQSMLWADTLLLSDNDALNGFSGTMSDIMYIAAPSPNGCHLYEIVQSDKLFMLRMVP